MIFKQINFTRKWPIGVYKLIFLVIRWSLWHIGNGAGMFAAIILGINANPVLADKPRESSSQNGFNTDDMSGFRKIEDGSVISNEHTAKWRLFSDKGREVFLQASLFCYLPVFFISFIWYHNSLFNQIWSVIWTGKVGSSWKILLFCSTRSKSGFWGEGSSCCLILQQPGKLPV